MNNRFAVLIDGEFMRKELIRRLGGPPGVMDFSQELIRICRRIEEDAAPRELSLYRVFYYTAEPFGDTRENPVDKQRVNFSTTSTYRETKSLIADLELQDNVSVRRGELSFRGWGLKRGAETRLMKEARKGITQQPISAADIRANFVQKGVDMRIGLDIATLALKRLVSDVVVVAGDLDMVPALKLARREGLRVYVDKLGTGDREQLRAHSDYVIG